MNGLICGHSIRVDGLLIHCTKPKYHDATSWNVADDVHSNRDWRWLDGGKILGPNRYESAETGTP